MENFRIIGYYICEIIDTPDWLRGISRRLLSVSGCLAEQHPLPACFMKSEDKKQSREYQRKLRMDTEQYKEFSGAAARLFRLNRFDIDGRFLQLSDAQYFYEKLRAVIPCRIISISTTPEYYELFAEELRNSQSSGQMNGGTDRSLSLGNDILGWDISGFHSFLCNSLQEELPEAEFNGLGLLSNEFRDVIRFAGRLEGHGEPVLWIPFRIGAAGPD